MTEETQEVSGFKEYADSIVGIMREALIIVSPDNVIQKVNTATLHLLGYTEDELVGKPVYLIIDKEGLFKEAEHARGTEKYRIKGRETIYRSKQGKAIPVLTSNAVARNSDGAIQAIIYAGTDISDYKRLEEELHRTEEKAVSIGKVKDEFLANMSH